MAKIDGTPYEEDREYEIEKEKWSMRTAAIAGNNAFMAVAVGFFRFAAGYSGLKTALFIAGANIVIFFIIASQIKEKPKPFSFSRWNVWFESFLKRDTLLVLFFFILTLIGGAILLLTGHPSLSWIPFGLAYFLSVILTAVSPNMSNI